MAMLSERTPPVDHPPGALVNLDAHTQAGLVGAEFVVGRHRLADAACTEGALFTDESIAALLDDYPSELLFALTMGTDPERMEENERLDHAGITGHELLTAVRKGRIWCNITNVDRVDSRFRALTDRLYGEITEQAPGFASTETHATLLVSSPGAMVYFHVDGPPSFLWHVRGHKRVWVYPALDPSVLPRALLEDVFAGTRQEYVPYRNEFDQVAMVHDLMPGEVAMWPQNAPHRVANLGDLNVSLVTDHYTRAARRRARVYTANRFLRVKAHVPQRWLGTSPTSLGAGAKVAVHQLGQRLHLDDKTSKAHPRPTRRVDPDSEIGMSAVSPNVTR